MPNFTIRKATTKDVAQIVEIEELCFATPWTYESLIHDMTENKLARYMVAIVNDDLAAEAESTIAGYIGTWLVYGESNITNVAVRPEFRRQHLASHLVQALIDAVECEGVTDHTLEVRVSNTPAQKLYQTFGFKPEGLRKGYYTDNGEDAIIMWLRKE